jgi:glycosyltransferase involved in cell wall biosynthesis
MRILFWTVAPWANTGYGLPARHLSQEFSRQGHEVAIYSFTGAILGQTNWDGIPIFGTPAPGGGTAHSYFEVYYRYWQADVAIQEFDLWVAKEIIEELDADVRVISHTPVDHRPLSPWLLEPLAQCHGIVPLCRFAYDVMLQAGLEPFDPIPNGIDTQVFKPMDKTLCRRRFGLPEDAFVFLTVAVNKGDRKNLPAHLVAFSDFLTRNPKANAIYLFWTYPFFDRANPEGFDLPTIWRQLGGPNDRVMFPPDVDYLHGMTEEAMAAMYNCADVLVMCSKGEGLCLPVIEAAACGVPSIVTNFSSLPELTGYGEWGWLVQPVEWACQQFLSSWFSIPSTGQMVEQMERAYREAGERQQFGKRAYEFAQDFDWVKLARRWQPVLEAVAAMPPKQRKTSTDTRLPSQDELPKVTEQGQHLPKG